MNGRCTLRLADIQLVEGQTQALISAYDAGYEAKPKDPCPYSEGTALAVNWELGQEHAECEGRFQ